MVRTCPGHPLFPFCPARCRASSPSPTRRGAVMVGYEVITSDEKKVGRVAEIVGDNLVVEHGTLMKSRHALPKAFAHADDSAHVVRVTVPKEILLDSPKIGSRGLDADAVAAHYGLASADTD